MAVTVEVCESCKTLFHYPGFGIKLCPSCREVDKQNQQKVKEYIRENGASNMYQISEATGVSTKIIKQYLRDGMLEIPDGSPIYIQCESCGCDIKSGRWCSSCAAKLSVGFKGLFVGVGEEPKNNENKGKMRFLQGRR